MDNNLAKVERSSDVARDLAELAEEIRSTVLRHDLIDDWLTPEPAEMEYLEGVSRRNWHMDGPEALHLPHDNREANAESMWRERQTLYACFKALDDEADATAKRLALEYVKQVRANLREWVEDTRA